MQRPSFSTLINQLEEVAPENNIKHGDWNVETDSCKEELNRVKK
jgi:hypothetical protein